MVSPMSARFPCLRAQGTARRQGQTSWKAFRPGLRGEAFQASGGLHIWMQLAQKSRTSSLRQSRPPSSGSQPASPARRTAESPSYARLSRGCVLPRDSRENARIESSRSGRESLERWVHSKCERFADQGKAHLQTLHHQTDCISPAQPCRPSVSSAPGSTSITGTVATLFD